MAFANCQNDLRSHYLLHRSEKVCMCKKTHMDFKTTYLQLRITTCVIVYVNQDLCNRSLFSLTGTVAASHRGTVTFIFIFLCFVCGRVTICTVLQLDLYLHVERSIPSMTLYDLYVPNQDSLCLFNKRIMNKQK